MDVAFRLFEPPDLAALEGMIAALYAEDPQGESITSEKIHRTLDELARHPEKGCVVLFLVDGAGAGYALLIFYWSNELSGDVICVDELYVKPEWRGRGIATGFFERLAAGEWGCAKGLQLEVAPANTRALALYERLGFRSSDYRQLEKRLEI